MFMKTRALETGKQRASRNTVKMKFRSWE